MRRLIAASVIMISVVLMGGLITSARAQSGDLKPKLATSADEIIGTWHTGGCVSHNCYVRFEKEGIYREAGSPDLLDTAPHGVSSYRFNGTEMAVSEVSIVRGLPSCSKTIGRYQVQLLEGGNVRIVLIEDPCTRAANLAAEYKPGR